jgi:hypothetical protein
VGVGNGVLNGPRPCDRHASRGRDRETSPGRTSATSHRDTAQAGAADGRESRGRRHRRSWCSV